MSKAYDPYENVIDVMTEAMEVGHIDKKMFEIINGTNIFKYRSHCCR